MITPERSEELVDMLLELVLHQGEEIVEDWVETLSVEEQEVVRHCQNTTIYGGVLLRKSALDFRSALIACFPGVVQNWLEENLE